MQGIKYRAVMTFAAKRQLIEEVLKQADGMCSEGEGFAWCFDIGPGSLNLDELHLIGTPNAIVDDIVNELVARETVFRAF